MQVRELFLTRFSMIRIALMAVLVASAVVSFHIFMTDRDLWEAAPSHAYALGVFIIVDLSVAIMTICFTRRGVQAAIVWALVKFIILLGDVATARDVGFQSYSQFALYLFRLWNFDLLLVMQLMIAALAFISILS